MYTCMCIVKGVVSLSFRNSNPLCSHHSLKPGHIPDLTYVHTYIRTYMYVLLSKISGRNFVYNPWLINL